MSKRLDTYLTSALEVRANWDGKPQSLPWSWLKQSLPMSERTKDDAADRLAVALNMIGVRCHVADRKAILRCGYTHTGTRDQAAILARAFESRFFGPIEIVAADTLARVAWQTSGKANQRAQALLDSLGQTGFSVIARTSSEPSIELRQKTKRELRLARLRKYDVSESVAGDSLLEEHFSQFPNYRSATQRDVIHAILDDNSPTMIIARMPTGGGKSLTFLLPAAEWSRRQEPSTSIVISPVIALMNDMMRKIEQEYGQTGLTAAEINSTVPLNRRTEIYRKLQRGELNVLFLSPEKAVEPFFRETLLASAEHIRLLVIDEAHMVREWGQDFRTDFFRLGEIRRRLIERGSPLKTLFLSATLTAVNERVLLEVFGDSEHVVRFEESALRKELSIRVLKYRAHEDKLAAAIPLIEQVEKPCIVYCGQKKHVTEIQKLLKERGLRRVFTYTGNTNPEYRRARLEAFHAGDIDVVLATNAFGLGVDKQNVRTVIHFDVPQNLDAYYQEIGRCARDGCTGHAFLLYTPGSMGHAVKSQLALLKSDTAAARATAMLDERFDLPTDGPGACLLPLHALATHIEQNSLLNQNWNAATLNLLGQVGDLDVGLRVLRHVEVRRGDPRAWNRVEKGAANTLGLRLIEEQLGRRSTGNVDLAKAAKKAKVPFLEAEAAVVRVALRGAIELTALDEDKGQAWVFARRKRGRTWSPEHTARLARLRAEQMEEAARGIGELRSFVKGHCCRLTAFAKLYGIQWNGHCGHCDRCHPRLAIG